MNTMWLDEPPMYGFTYDVNHSQESIPVIKNWRRTEFVDFQRLGQITKMKTYDFFGDVDPARIAENSCLSLVQINAINEIVANISLCNYPNVPSIPTNAWLEWISNHYGIQGITGRNTLFVHMLIWDTRYNNIFYKRMLDAVFISSIHTTYVIFVMPSWVTPVGFVEEHMTRIVPNGQTDSYKVQALYISLRHMHCPRLKIRRVVEEDNDDIIPILDRESDRFKELYGQFYISEMMRYPDGIRQLVVAENDGLPTGVLCLNKIIDVDTLNQHFELGPYHGLRKHHLGDKIPDQKDTQYNSLILFPTTELENEDHFKVKPVSKTSTFSFEEGIDEDYLSDEDRTEPECFCSDDGDICNKVYSDAPCPSCIETWRNPMNKISTDVGIENRIFKGNTPSLSSVEKTNNKPTSILSKLEKSDFGNEERKVNDYGINTLKKTERLSIPRGLKPENLSQETHQKVPALEFNVMDNVTVSTSLQRSSTRSALRISDNLNSDVKTASINLSKIHLSDLREDNSFVEEESRLTDVAVEINPRNVIHKYINLPVYKGEINAFTLELFSMREDVDEKLSYDYLESVFECFPGEEYCVVLIPPYFPTFPLLQSFVRVPLRFNKDYPLVMYLAHRASVVGEFKTREATLRDMEAVEELIDNLPNRCQILKDFEFSFDNYSPYQAYIFLCEGTTVGFSILCEENEIESIRSHYQIDDFISFDRISVDHHARIIHLTIMPIFASLHRYFFQELMILNNKHSLYYRLYHNDASAMTRSEPLVTFLGEMIPVLPRRKFKYCSNNYEKNKSNDFIIRDSNRNNFALYMIVPRIASIPKIDINVRVVVVGASDCGLSVLETLVFGPNAAFVSLTNITLISPNGIPFENRPDDIEKDELPFGGRYSRDYRQLIGTRAWINVVHGTMTAINRKDKFVTVSTMGSLSYDYLILACGLQYQRPKFSEELRAEKRGDLRDYQNPENCLTINTERDAANCLSYCVRLFAENPSCSVIFYGRNIDSYSAVMMLIKSGIPAENITLLEPAVKMCEDQNTTFFGNAEVEEAVIKASKESGINLLSGWDLVDWNLEEYDEDFFIRSLILEQKGDRKELDCQVLFNFKEKTINMDTFLAICRSGLVFDGSLVIDPEFKTNDPCIFSAGTMTKYSRRFYANESSHKYYNPLEVGERLGQKLRNIIDPKNSEDDILTPQLISRLDMILPVFKKPIITSCRLPGGYYYLNVKKPGKLITDDTNDVVLITGYPASNIGYFRLHLNQFDTVETITCLNKKDFEIENYVNLYGKHQTLLNDIKIRFQKSMVPDLYAYFREPWAMALFLDRFDCLRVENRATLLSATVVCGDTLIHDCTKALIKSKWDTMKPEDRELIETRYAGSVYQEELENSLVDFLQYFEMELPMYCNPRFLRQFLNDVERVQDDPLFRRTNSH